MPMTCIYLTETEAELYDCDDELGWRAAWPAIADRADAAMRSEGCGSCEIVHPDGFVIDALSRIHCSAEVSDA